MRGSKILPWKNEKNVIGTDQPHIYPRDYIHDSVLAGVPGETWCTIEYRQATAASVKLLLSNRRQPVNEREGQAHP